MTDPSRGGDDAIVLSGVGKRYTTFKDTPTLASGLLHLWTRSTRSTLWAVRGVNLTVAPGESLGIMGRNGSGKSTLLQMLCGVTAPTEGEVRVRGRIAPLISVGVGFHPELTGRENVYVNGAILGLSRPEIDARLDEIIAFSEIEAFVDTPVKFYSSGMYVRLGFSVAAHVQPDVLLVDEVLAVGDLGFQIKCFEHMDRLLARGTTIVVVSHNLAAVQRLCSRALVLAQGRVLADTDVGSAISLFHEVMGDAEATDVTSGDVRIERGVVDVVTTDLLRADGTPAGACAAGDRLRVRVRVRAHAHVTGPFLSVMVLNEAGVQVFQEHNVFDPYPALAAGEERDLDVELGTHLATGTYTLLTSVGRGTPGDVDRLRRSDDVALFAPPRRSLFFVRGRDTVVGIADLHASFGV